LSALKGGKRHFSAFKAGKDVRQLSKREEGFAAPLNRMRDGEHELEHEHWGKQVSSSDFPFLEMEVGPAVASRANPIRNLLEAMKKRAAGLQGNLPRFPSLLISADALVPQGAFAEAQAQYLRPDPAQVDRLVKVR
jgi:hypothetical protein